MKSARQLVLPFRPRGGARPGSGPNPKGAKAGLPHRARPEHAPRHPVHVSLKVGAALPSLRAAHSFAAVSSALRAGAERPGFRLVHWSVQSNHLHLIVEAEDKSRLWRGLRGLQTRIAMRLNRALGRRGRVFHDRYHAHALRTPREVARAVEYVLRNFKHHLERQGYRVPQDGTGDHDACASCAWPPPASPSGPEPEAQRAAPGRHWPIRPRTWLLALGWLRAG